MPDRFTLPPPGLFHTEIINLGPVIDPPFSDARDWGDFVTPVQTSPVSSEPHELAFSGALPQQAVDLALASDNVVQELDGKRYEVMNVALRSQDRQTEYPLVIAYNYTDDVVLEIVVDLAGNTVLEVASKRYQPALTPSEESRALELVRRDGWLPGKGIDIETGSGIIVEEVNFRSPRYGHRLVDLRFGPADRRVPIAFAIVDLTSQDVVRTGLIPEGAS